MRIPVQILMTASLLSTPVHAQSPIRIPIGAAPTIDGVIRLDEWNDAVETKFSDGTALKLKRDSGFIYLAFHGATEGFPSVCVTRGDTTRILHASAALASATFTGRDAQRTLNAPFAFALRTAETGAVLRAYLDANRWVSSNNAMHKTDREMAIATSLFDPLQPRIAVGFYRASDESSVSLPVTLVDGCTATRTVQGWLPTDPVTFKFDEWLRLTLR